MRKNKTISLEGNNGGDYLKIEMLPDDLIRIRVGHCCVATNPEIVPVEILTATLFWMMTNDWRTALDAISWPADFKVQLKEKADAAQAKY